MREPTIVTDVADTLAGRIVAGTYPAGGLAPSVRQLAEEFSVNRATAQLVLVRLEAARLVEARRGRGFVVRDLRRDGGLDVCRVMLRHARLLPDTAVGLFSGVLELYHDVLTRSARVVAAHPARHDHRPAVAALGAFEELSAVGAAPGALLRAELDIARAFAAAAARPVRIALLNSVAEILLDLPEAAAAHYPAGPTGHVLLWRTLVTGWAGGVVPTAAELDLLDDVLELRLRQVGDRFARLLRGSPGAALRA
ncbi:winged helix-turn-helix domain-containing protein [Actinocorallia sp. A-T 12471]|uniref:winged helix-turn-helix domain-containing protein n=1 Tax=Actinocorallia sp. A-T 12471 TaxID=3089813 RepID=UPI0029CC9496|nr:winged helix-turn-helix domain-containing protein [Actinocorallia sp. A-T 12471]MDX6744398.1 winged helix-turn-helix domain-containing protein [Actinocorallia sp. A-T 12471]